MGGGEERPAAYTGRYESERRGGEGGPVVDTERYGTGHVYRDRVRWGPILAGVFVALSVSALLGLLGLAIGATAWDPQAQQGEAFGWGFAIWGVIVLILAFGAGGWIAARSASVPGEPTAGLLNGAMVWAVGVPVMFWVLTGTFGTIMGPAAMMAQSMPEQGQQTYATPREDPQAQQPADQVEPEEAQTAVNTGAWGTLIALLLGLCAAAGGGYLGGASGDDRHKHRQDRDRDRDRDREREHASRRQSGSPPPPTTEP